MVSEDPHHRQENLIAIRPPALPQVADIGVIAAGRTGSAEGGVMGRALHSVFKGASVTAHITNDTSGGAFSISGLATYTYESVDNGELPGHHGPPVLFLSTLDEVKGTGPIDTAEAAALSVQVDFRAPASPGRSNYTATAIFLGANGGSAAVSISALVAAISTKVVQPATIRQGQTGPFVIEVSSLNPYSPDAAVTYSLNLPAGTFGVDVVGDWKVTVPAGQTVRATLQLRVARTFPLGRHTLQLVENAFFGPEHTLHNQQYDFVSPEMALTVLEAPWSDVISSDDVVAIHAVLVPTANGDGEILLFGGDEHDRAANIAGHFDHSRRFNCRHPNQPLVYVPSPNADLFCCGHCYMGDGRVLIAGGTLTFPPQSEGDHHGIHFEGHRRAFIYEPAKMRFTEVTSMGSQPGKSQGGGRWYPTLCTLPTGEVLAVAGHPMGDDTRHNNNRPERYQPLANRWIMLSPTCPDTVPAPDVYPRLHVLSNGMVFVSSALQDNPRCIVIDPSVGSKREICDLPDDAYHGYDCPSVLLPLTPADGYRPRVLLCGGVTSQMIDLGNPAPTWVTVPRNGTTAGLGRAHACATILPTGDVLMTGGADPNNDQSGVMNPELYITPTDQAAGTPTYGPGPGRWNTINEPATILRNYHSTALLMPDGRVWTAGGNNPSQPESPPTIYQKMIEIFDPPYPLGPRPTIISCPSTVDFGQKFVVQTPQAQQIHQVTLLRCGSSTHAFNPDQRCIFLSFATVTTDRLQVTAPPNGAVAPPGTYMIFLIDNQGRPCQYANFVQVGRISPP
jgi:hypothetical protein